ENPIDPATGQRIGKIGDPAVANLVMDSATNGQQGIDPSGFGQNPHIRDIEFRVRNTIGPDRLTGVPVDIAFDNLMNLSGLPNSVSNFSAGTPLQANGKSQVKLGGATNANEATFMFLAVPFSDQGGGVVDVIRLDSGFQRFDTDPFQSGVQSIPAQGVSVLMDYFRQ
ncbi:MAG: hypothetical protein ACYTG6_18060, partial [Planctomycetota bacterium]